VAQVAGVAVFPNAEEFPKEWNGTSGAFQRAKIGKLLGPMIRKRRTKLIIIFMQQQNVKIIIKIIIK